MIVCSCNVFSDGEVRNCLNPGPDCPRTPAQVYRSLGCGAQCGRCATTIRSIMDRTLAQKHACSEDCGGNCPLTQQANMNEPPARQRWQRRSLGWR
ncbi:(2Fe-2S)-binding protein [Microvirga sp. SYSU G3D207]|uniref:Bacterioferritin-associated ferredoxin n=1 Tax=Microvirga arsenatis TaxID=2692265 RepID=A0ABW9YYT7_9HYPH|nr:(2Fe-2S)-binding protein [Microvirga arsenatis]NBJ11092.1 (2Fe-2S)-binding protein [Microvirga arsenatis]NBJ25365.1 (2Fe-2S)-binding protein [Microvirga arsenatis]